MKKVTLYVFINCFVTILLIVSFQCCENNDSTLNNNTNYPSTYKRLDTTVLNQIRTDFANANPFLTSSITDFGFCGFLNELLPAHNTVRIPDLTKKEALNATNLFITQNSKQLGVQNPTDFTFERIDSFMVYDGSFAWHFVSAVQKYNGIEVENSTVLFILVNGKMTSCQGNWYPYIYIPVKININEEKAKSILLNKIVYLSDIAGRSIPMTITAKSLETSLLMKKIYPVQLTDKIELHVVWQVTIPDVYYVIFLDVMSGEIIGGYPTALS